MGADARVWLAGFVWVTDQETVLRLSRLCREAHSCWSVCKATLP